MLVIGTVRELGGKRHRQTLLNNSLVNHYNACLPAHPPARLYPTPREILSRASRLRRCSIAALVTLLLSPQYTPLARTMVEKVYVTYNQVLRRRRLNLPAPALTTLPGAQAMPDLR